MPKPDDMLPLKPLHFLMLLTLVDTERHAYGIKKYLASRSEHPDIGAGTLYRSIAQLDRQRPHRDPIAGPSRSSTTSGAAIIDCRHSADAWSRRKHGASTRWSRPLAPGSSCHTGGARDDGAYRGDGLSLADARISRAFRQTLALLCSSCFATKRETRIRPAARSACSRSLREPLGTPLPALRPCGCAAKPARPLRPYAAVC